jgi:hypothetical protein
VRSIIAVDFVLVVNPEDAVGATLVAELKSKLGNPMHIGKVIRGARRPPRQDHCKLQIPSKKLLASKHSAWHDIRLLQIMSYPGLSKLSDITRAFRGQGVGLPFELKVLEICLDMVGPRQG